MTDHTTDPFSNEAISETQRAAGLNAALHIHNSLSQEKKDDHGVKELLADAEAISRFLYDGTQPA